MTHLLTVIDLTTVAADDEPRIKDVRIGERLGMVQPVNIRQTIEANKAELEQYGSIHAAREMIVAGKGARREITAYHLNEAQTILLCMFSRTERAAMVRKEVIEAFIEYRKATAAPPIQAATARGRRISTDRGTAVRLAALVERMEKLPAAKPADGKPLDVSPLMHLNRDGIGTIRINGRTHLFDSLIGAKPSDGGYMVVLGADDPSPSIRWADPIGDKLRLAAASIGHPWFCHGLANVTRGEAMILGRLLASDATP